MCHEEEFKCECILAELQQAVSVMCTFYIVVLKVVSHGPTYRVNYIYCGNPSLTCDCWTYLLLGSRFKMACI